MYNSQANGIIERRHLDVQEALLKACEGETAKWSRYAHSVFWAKRITVQQATERSSYYMVHSVEPVLPFDLTEATYLLPLQDLPLFSMELITLRAWQLQKQPEDLEEYQHRVTEARKRGLDKFIKENKNRIADYTFAPGSLVLMQNSKVRMSLDGKMKLRYLGLYVVVCRTQGGSYIITELDGLVAHFRVGAARLLLYRAHTKIKVPLGDFIQSSASELDDLEDEIKNSDGEDEAEPAAHSNMVKVVNTTRIPKEQYDALSLFGSSYLVNY